MQGGRTFKGIRRNAPMKKGSKHKHRWYCKYTIEKSLRHHLLEWGATILSLTGAVLNARFFIEGFWFWSVANIFWMIFAMKYKHYGLFVQNLVFLFINILGIYTWLTTGNYNFLF